MPYQLVGLSWVLLGPLARGKIVIHLGDDWFLLPTGEIRKMIFEIVLNHMQAL